MSIFWQIVGFTITIAGMASAVGVIGVLSVSVLPMTEARAKEVYVYLKKFSLMMLISGGLALVFMACNVPVIGEGKKDEFIISQYNDDEGKSYHCYLVYDDEIEQYRYTICDFQNLSLINLTAPLDSEIIRSATDGPMVKVMSYEVRTKLTNRIITHIAHQVFVIPDVEYAITDKENMQQNILADKEIMRQNSKFTP